MYGKSTLILARAVNLPMETFDESLAHIHYGLLTIQAIE